MFYIMTLVSGTDVSATYKYLTTVEAETGKLIKKSFPTIEDAEQYVKQEMIASGLYSLSQFLVCKGVTVTADVTLVEETL